MSIWIYIYLCVLLLIEFGLQMSVCIQCHICLSKALSFAWLRQQRRHYTEWLVSKTMKAAPQSSAVLSARPSVIRWRNAGLNWSLCDYMPGSSMPLPFLSSLGWLSCLTVCWLSTLTPHHDAATKSRARLSKTCRDSQPRPIQSNHSQ